VRDVARLAGLADEPALRAQGLADQVMVHGAGREQHRDRREIRRHAPIREDQDVHAFANRGSASRTARRGRPSAPSPPSPTLKSAGERAERKPGS
jgi:hypothetical protein